MGKFKNILRKKLFKYMNNEMIDKFYKIYYRLRYHNQLCKKCSFGEKNIEKIFYIIRPRTDCTEGLMSLFMNVSKNIFYALENDYIPVIDFKNYRTQYSDKYYEGINVWETFFTQPTEFSLDEVYASKNVILSGLEIQWYHPSLFVKDYSDMALRKLHDFIFSKVGFSENIIEFVDSEMKKLNINLSKTLAVYLRGTDYTSLKPAGHPVQPTVRQAVEVIDRFLLEYDIDHIFLVTEDGKIYSEIKHIYKDQCVIVSYDKFIENYSGKDYISHDKSVNELSESPYERGRNYLAKLIILSNCSYFVGGDTMGSWAACTFSEKSFREKFIFDLGIYGK